MTILRLENPIQHYDWGCPDKIPELFGIPNPEHLPLAEIWMGAHPKAPSKIHFNNLLTPLNELLNKAPELLGEDSIRKFGSRLPFLFKIISAAQPLSIQAHPNKQQAIAGFEVEEKSGIPVTAFNRNYKDNNHKPELLYALTPFKTMNGFRPVEEIIALFRMADIPELSSSLQRFEKELCNQNQGLKQFYELIMNLSSEEQQVILSKVIKCAKNKQSSEWLAVKQLNEIHPGDIGILSPLLLNVVTLNPGEAMFLRAGTLHAYLEGTGLEIMACSDNVLRGGLTRKHIDIPELLKTIQFAPIPKDKILLSATPAQNGEIAFPTEIDDFLFSVIDTENVIKPLRVKSAEILICLEGEQTVQLADGKQLALKPGESCFIGLTSLSYSINGTGKLARAAAIV